MAKTNLNISFANLGAKRYRYGANDASWPSTDTTTQVSAYSRVETRTTTNTPGFRNGKGALYRESLPMNPFAYSLRDSSAPYGLYEIRNPGTRERVDGFLELGTNMEPRGITPADRDRIGAEAQLAILQALKEQRVNIGITLGERKETSALILDAARRIGTSFRALKRGDLKRALDAVSNTSDASRILRELQRPRKGPSKGSVKLNRFSLSNEALVVQLGWKPLLADVYNYAEMLAAKANDPARTKTSASRSHRWSGPFGASEQWQGVPVDRTEYGIYTEKYVLYYSVHNEFTKTLAELGITNPLSWLYELTALSFVFDWFLRVGDFIDVLDATVGLTFEKGCKTTFEKCRVRYRCKGSVGDDSSNTYVSGSASKLHVDVRREVLSTFPSVPSVIQGSGITSLSRGITAAALIRQYFKR